MCYMPNWVLSRRSCSTCKPCLALIVFPTCVVIGLGPATWPRKLEHLNNSDLGNASLVTVRPDQALEGLLTLHELMMGGLVLMLWWQQNKKQSLPVVVPSS